MYFVVSIVISSAFKPKRHAITSPTLPLVTCFYAFPKLQYCLLQSPLTVLSSSPGFGCITFKVCWIYWFPSFRLSCFSLAFLFLPVFRGLRQGQVWAQFPWRLRHSVSVHQTIYYQKLHLQINYCSVHTKSLGIKSVNVFMKFWFTLLILSCCFSSDNIAGRECINKATMER